MDRRFEGLRFSPAGCILLTAALLLLPLQWVAAWLTAVIVHELGHIIAIRLTGGRITSVRMSWNGAVIESHLQYRWQELLAALAGPAASFLLLIGVRLFPRVALCGLAQGMYNLLPLYPLDGGRVFCLLLKKERSQKVGQLIVICVLGAVSFCLALRFSMGIAPLLCFAWLLFKYRTVKTPCKHAVDRLQ